MARTAEKATTKWYPGNETNKQATKEEKKDNKNKMV